MDSPLHLGGATQRPATRTTELGEHGREVPKSHGYSRECIDSPVREGVLREPVAADRAS